jgi:anion-transporting  ArsA/GET3 family ATPase
LLVWEIDAGKQFRKFLDRHRRAILDMVESGTIFSRSEIEPLLDATLPGMAEFAALLAIRDLVASARYNGAAFRNIITIPSRCLSNQSLRFSSPIL